MTTAVKLNEIERVYQNVEFPITRKELLGECGTTTIQLADGTVDFDSVIGESNTDTFYSPDDITTELMNLLPRNAVGEPYQSDGDA